VFLRGRATGRQLNNNTARIGEQNNMNAHRRPGGLTALAVVNFIFGGLSALSVLGMFAVLALMRSGLAQNPGSGTPEQQAQLDALMEMGRGPFLFMAVCSAILAAALIVSGIGYLKLKRFLGRTLGNATALFSIAASLLTALWMSPQLGGGFNLGTVIGLIYPVLTLFFLNVTFKEDFVNP
jgi:hypothetical protein